MAQVRFTSVTRTIDPKTRIHYLDAIDDQGNHWVAEMEHETERWLIYSRLWHKDPQQPNDYGSRSASASG